MRLITSILLALLTALAPVLAAEFSAHRQGVLIRGTIDKGDYAKLVDFVRHPDNSERFAKTVYLDSPGGDVVEAVKMARLLDKAYAATHVASGARCYSACFMLWMSGVTRHVSLGATLGVHRIRMTRGSSSLDEHSDDVVAVSQGVDKYLQDLGTPRTILDKMNSTASSDLFVISPRWLMEQRLLIAMSYRMGFVETALPRCGPEPLSSALKEQFPVTEDSDAKRVASFVTWTRCTDALRAHNQKIASATY